MRTIKNLFRNRIGILILIVLFSIILLVILGSSKHSSVSETTNSSMKNLIGDNSSQSQNNDSTIAMAVKKTLSEEGLCEDYTLKENESMVLDSHTIKVERISKTGIMMSVDDTNFYLSEGSEERVDNFLVELLPDKIFYFEPRDPINAVSLRLGCKSSKEDPKDKYVREKGADICKELYTECKSKFGIEN